MRSLIDGVCIKLLTKQSNSPLPHAVLKFRTGKISVSRSRATSAIKPPSPAASCPSANVTVRAPSHTGLRRPSPRARRSGARTHPPVGSPHDQRIVIAEDQLDRRGRRTIHGYSAVGRWPRARDRRPDRGLVEMTLARSRPPQLAASLSFTGRDEMSRFGLLASCLFQGEWEQWRPSRFGSASTRSGG
jgi:hypothetical protein